MHDEIYLPLPYDCVQEKDSSNENAFCLPLVSREEVKTSSPVHHYLKSKTPVKKIEGGLLPVTSLKEYLSGTRSKIPFCKIPDCVMIESKIGISINRKTGSAEKTKLYNADFLRLETEKNKNFSLIISFGGLDLPKKGMMKLGGEGKAVHYEEYTTFDPSIIIPQHDALRFKLYLSTPTVFKKGWIPEWIDEKTLIGEYNDLQLELLTASMGKPLHIGGFDIKAGRPKPMRKAVPAGSVYYFKILDGNFQKAYHEFNHTALSDYNAEEGFGISYMGVIQDG
jgi:CRISPR-associated protein Cmr3